MNHIGGSGQDVTHNSHTEKNANIRFKILKRKFINSGGKQQFLLETFGPSEYTQIAQSDTKPLYTTKKAEHPQTNH